MSEPKHMRKPGEPRRGAGLPSFKSQDSKSADLDRLSSTSSDMNSVTNDTQTAGASAEQIGRSAALMSFLVIISRITGFFRTWGQVFAMGVTVTASCYTVANNLPNQLYELVMGGMLVTAFLPVYLSEKKKKGQKGANAYTSNLVSLVLNIMGAFCLLGIIFASQVVWTQSFNANDQFDHELANYFFRFFAIEVVLYSLSTILSGVLNAERDYLWSSAAPIFNNFVVTSSFFLYAALVGTNPRLALLILAIGNPLGVLIQVLVQIPSLKRHGIHLTFHVDLHDPAIKETLSIGVPSLLVTIVSFVTVSVQTSCALSVSVAGSSIAYYTRLWYTLPYSILAIPITTAMFTELSDRVSKNDMEGYVHGVVSGTAQILFFLIPCALLLVVFSEPLITILAAGKLSGEDIVITQSYLRALAVSLPFFGVYTYLQKVCSSLRKMGVFAVSNVVAGVIQVIFCFVLTPRYGLDMVALSSLFFFAAVDIVTFISLKAILGQLHLMPIVVSGMRSIVLGVLASFVSIGILKALPSLIGEVGVSVGKALLYCILAGIPGLLICFGVAIVCKFDEAAVVRKMLGRASRSKS